MTAARLDQGNEYFEKLRETPRSPRLRGEKQPSMHFPRMMPGPMKVKSDVVVEWPGICYYGPDSSHWGYGGC